MKLLVLLLSVILSVKAADTKFEIMLMEITENLDDDYDYVEVRGNGEYISSGIFDLRLGLGIGEGIGQANGISSDPRNMVESSKKYGAGENSGASLMIATTTPSPTNWTYSINGKVIAEGTEDFCEPNPMTPGGMAVQMLRTSLNLQNEECPIEQLVRKDQMQLSWEEDIDFDKIFNNTSITLADGESAVGSNSDNDFSSSAGSSDMKMTLEIKNNFVKSKFVLTNA